MLFEASYDSILAGHRVVVTPSPPASVCSETPRTRRRRLFLNRSCATLRESFCIKMSEDQKAAQEQEELSELRKSDQNPVDLSGNQKPSNPTRSRESSDTDLVHLTADDQQTEPQALHPTSELPHDVQSMPKSVSATIEPKEGVHVERTHEPGPVDSKPVDPNPYLQLKQPSELKGPHVDVIKREPTDIEEVGRGILATLLSPRVLIEVAAIGVLIGVYFLYKRR